jgi:hypothetical protein
LSFQKLNQRAGTVLGLALLLAAFAPLVLAQGQSPYLTPDQALQRARPCSCHPGIEQIENFMKDTADELHAWQLVEQEAEQQTMTPAQARARFNALRSNQLDKRLFGCSMKGVVGKTEGFFTCQVLVRQDYADCACDIIVASTIEHEQEHCVFNRLPTSWITFNVAKSLATSEVEAHFEQYEYLKEQLEALRNSDKCKPKLSLYAPPQRGGAGQTAIANAANRVGQYAAAID